MTTNSHNPFPLAMRPAEGGGPIVRVQVATCGKCGAEQLFNRQHGKAMPVEAVAKKLKLIGWTVKRDGSVCRCATCEGRTQNTAPNGEARVSFVGCDHDECQAKLPVPRSSRADNGRSVPNSIVKQTAKAAGWLAMPAWRDMGPVTYCPVHAVGIKALAIVVDAKQLGEDEAMRRACADYGLTGKEARAAMDEAEGTARASLGDETVDRALAALAEEMAAQAAVIQQREEEAATMNTPRTMTRADRRAIIEKLTATYDDDGYTGQWSDAKVASDLDMPVAWVAEIRAENFGDVTDSEADRAARKAIQTEINTLKSDLKAVRADVQKALNAAAEADAKLPGILSRLDAAEAKLKGK